VAAGDDELVAAERELVEIRSARSAALERSVALARAGNDLSAQHAARAARDFATAARALAGEVVLLRESDVRLTERQGEMLALALQGFVEAARLPWVPPLRELLSATLRRAAGEDGPDVGRAGERAADELHKHFAALLVRGAPAPDTQIDTEGAPHGDASRTQDSATGSLGDSLGAEPKPVAPLALEPASDDVPELVLCDASEVPQAWLSRFELGADGRERCRRAYSEHLRDQQRKREAAEAAAGEAERERVRAAAAQRAARRADPGPAPQGWDGRRGGRGRGPSERAGE
jgi:hypothetical protein